MAVVAVVEVAGVEAGSRVFLVTNDLMKIRSFLKIPNKKTI